MTAAGGASVPRDTAVTFSASGAGGLKALGQALGEALCEPLAGGQFLLLALNGELGAGKTTLAGAVLARLGVRGRVSSPTYGLVHPYPLHLSGGRTAEALHVDLYRLRGPAELDELGLEDGFEATPRGAGRLMLVEWFERAGGRLGSPDIALRLSHESSGRRVVVHAESIEGARIVSAVREAPHPELHRSRI